MENTHRPISRCRKMALRILVIEDDDEISDFVLQGLREEGFSVDRARDGTEGLSRLTHGRWDVAILDWWLPRLDGFGVLRRYREDGGQTPILFLTARGSAGDCASALNNGADDYLTKPFSFEVLLARIGALARRRTKVTEQVLVYGDVRLDLATQRAERAGSKLSLNPKEHALLALFLRHPEQLLSRTRIFEQVWDDRYDGESNTSNTMEVHIKELRKELEKHGPRLIFTRRGQGYLFGQDS